MSDPPDALPTSEAVEATLPRPLGCYDCGLVYGGEEWIEAVIPDEIWARISPKPNGGGVLCITCIARRLSRAGLREVPVQLCGTEPLIAAQRAAEAARVRDAALEEIEGYAVTMDRATEESAGEFAAAYRNMAIGARTAAMRIRALREATRG